MEQMLRRLQSTITITHRRTWRRHMQRETIEFDEVLEKVCEAFRKRKGYASFWDYPDKQVKERGVAKDLIESIELEEGNSQITHLVSNPNRYGAVDVFGADIFGKMIAYEVTELVSEEAIRLNRHGLKVHRKWDEADLVANLEGRLAAKDYQLSTVAYEKQVVVIFTDEPFLQRHRCVPILGGHAFGPFANIHEAYLLFSPEPGREGYPYIRLRLTRARLPQLSFEAKLS